VNRLRFTTVATAYAASVNLRCHLTNTIVLTGEWNLFERCIVIQCRVRWAIFQALESERPLALLVG